jgi:hypothetical protein
MKAIGIKFVYELSNGDITTWHDVFETTANDIINKIKHQKGWIGGKFIEAYLEFSNNGEYYKVYLDVNQFN